MAKGDPEKALEVADDCEEINPALLALLQDKLKLMALPAPVKRRLKALKNLQLESTKLEAQFYQDVHQLECRYFELYKPQFDLRAKITKGEYEPTEPECEWPSDHEDEDDEEVEVKQKSKDLKNEAVKGIPNFWATTLKNVELIQETIKEYDEPILEKLSDVQFTLSEKDPMGFTLHFYFEPNDYFTNSVLTKEYIMKCDVPKEDPFSFDGPEICKSIGCSIDWKTNKNVTVKLVNKKQKHKSKGKVRTQTKVVKVDSFFNFFSPPSVPDDPEAEVDPEIQDDLTVDFEIGNYIRDRIIPKAVLYFTGEALDDDDDDDVDEEELEEEDLGEEEEDSDGGLSKTPKQECKQQ